MGKNLLKKPNNAIIPELFRHSANKRRLSRNIDQHFFFCFFFKFWGFVHCNHAYSNNKIKTLEKVPFYFHCTSHKKIKQRLQWVG